MTDQQAVQCCIVGGGPAGMMLGYLMGRAGVRTLVLEKHGDFLRDFRGDTVHPSTLQIMHDLGLLQDFLQRPHSRLTAVSAVIEGRSFKVADFSHLPTVCKFIAFMPQWDFLDFLAEQAKALPAFTLMMQAEAAELITEDGRVAGVRVQTPTGPLQVRADLVVACDGRGSAMRAAAGLPLQDLGAPIDVLWFRLAKRPGDPDQALGRLAQGRIIVTLDRGDYWQCAYVIRKGGAEAVRAAGLAAFRQAVGEAAPFLADRTDALKHLDDVKLLSVSLDRLTRWSRPGLLCIGDAAHAMSPVGGVGINLAIQDAVATANLLAAKLKAGAVTDRDLDAVRRRRLWPVTVIQALQAAIQTRVLAAALHRTAPLPVPWAVKLLDALPWLRRAPGYLIGLGVRRERVRSPLF